MSERTLNELLDEKNVVEGLPGEDPEHALIHYKEREVLRARIRELELEDNREEYLRAKLRQLENFIQAVRLDENVLLDKLAERMAKHTLIKLSRMIEHAQRHEFDDMGEE